MKKAIITLLLLILAGTGIWYGTDWPLPFPSAWRGHISRLWRTVNWGTGPESQDKLYGHVDIRQISLAFENGGRLREMLAEEGDFVRAGQTLARTDTEQLLLKKAQLLAEIAAREQALLKLEHGSRPEEIAQAEAMLASAQASAEQARRQHQRMKDTFRSSAVSRQDLENAQAAHEVAQARVTEAEKALELLRLGPRAEDIASAKAQLDAARAGLAVLEYAVSSTELTAPADAVVSSRLLEPGAMVSAQTPVYLLSLQSPKWVRAYVEESRLGRIRPGMEVALFADGFPDPTPGQVGSVSSVAEFTPKSVQTEELRTALMYEVRILAKDAQNRLRLGMPVTVRLSAPSGGEQSSGASWSGTLR